MATISFFGAQTFPYRPDTQLGLKEKDMPKTKVTEDTDY